MNKVCQILALGLILFSSVTVATAENTLLAQNALASTVKLKMDHGGYGSGFLVAPGRVATNLHVIHGAITGTAELVGQKTDRFKIKGFTAIADKHDLVILEVPGLVVPPNVSPLSLGDSEDMNIGETVYAVGNPAGFDGTFSEGNISGIRKDANGTLLQMTAPISPGSSGGPVLNKHGDVIGVSVAAGPGQNLNFAIPSNYLKSLLKPEMNHIQDLSEAAIRMGIVETNGMLDLEWLHSDYPSYRIILENLRRQDAKNIYYLMTFLDKEGKIIGLDFAKVMKIPAGDTVHVTRPSIFSYESKKESEKQLMLLNKSDGEQPSTLARRVVSDGENIEKYNFLAPQVRQLRKEIRLRILGFDMERSFNLIQDN